MRERLTIRYRKLTDTAVEPTCSHGAADDAGMDLYAAEAQVVPAGEWKSVRTGICIEIPEGFEGQVRPRSGLARRRGLTVLNSPGTIDPGYRGEVQVTLINHGNSDYLVRAGDRIAQLVVAAYAQVRWELADSLTGSSRGSGGFGSTGR